MTSTERHEARYRRRKSKREAKRREHTEKYDDFERLSSVSALIKSHWDSRKGVMWKASVARYDAHFFRNARRASRSMREGKDTRMGFYHFNIVERGKPREVHSLHYAERVIRRSVCMNAMVPILSHNLIYDNGASLKNKGITFHIDRCERQLREYFREYGDNEGYVLIIDFRKFFDNIEHEPVFQMYDKYIRDDRLNAICKGFVTATGTKGLYIGPEDSQITAVSFPNSIDHLIKDSWRIKGYGRYMDDSFIIMRDKKALMHYRDLLLQEFSKIGIIPNPKKTQIVKLSRGFTFLKTQFFLTKTGRVIKKPCRGSVIRERRKIKAFRRFCDDGIMTDEQSNYSYMSWRGSLKDRNSHRTLRETDLLYYRLFTVKPWVCKKKRKGNHHVRDHYQYAGKQHGCPGGDYRPQVAA